MTPKPRSAAPRQTERDFQRAVMELAELSGWETLHVRTSMQQGRYMTATTGTMAKGWPDLVLIHPKRRRLLFVELKGARGRERPDQTRVLDVIGKLCPVFVDEDGFTCYDPIGVSGPTIGVHIWRPADWTSIEATLTNQEERAA